MKPKSELILYQTEDNRTRIEVRLENETVWLTQAQMAELFETTIPNVSMHIRNILAEGELQTGSVVKEFLTTAADGKNYITKFHNLDVIIAVGYRVKSHRGTQFRTGGAAAPPYHKPKTAGLTCRSASISGKRGSPGASPHQIQETIRRKSGLSHPVSRFVHGCELLAI